MYLWKRKCGIPSSRSKEGLRDSGSPSEPGTSYWMDGRPSCCYYTLLRGRTPIVTGSSLIPFIPYIGYPWTVNSRLNWICVKIYVFMQRWWPPSKYYHCSDIKWHKSFIHSVWVHVILTYRTRGIYFNRDPGMKSSDISKLSSAQGQLIKRVALWCKLGSCHARLLTQLLTIRFPFWVIILSGWNCTPCVIRK